MSNNGAATRFCNDDVGPTAIEEVTIVEGGAWALVSAAHHAAHLAASSARERPVVETLPESCLDPYLAATTLHRGGTAHAIQRDQPLPHRATSNALQEPVGA